MEDANDPILLPSEIPYEPKTATNVVANTMLNVIWPLIINVRKKLQSEKFEDCNPKVKEVFTLCCSQIKKTTLSLFNIFKLEHRRGINLQESRKCTLEWLSWCINKLKSIDQILDRMDDTCNSVQDSDNSLLTTPMYFVNWIDHAFEILAKLSDIIYRNDCNESTEQHGKWKCDAVECIKELHMCLDELLLSAMTLGKYCLPSDQHIVKARCQVVLRETKALLEELVIGDFNTVYKVTEQSLKLPIMPSNVNVLIDVLKDVLYVLETNTNTALLALLVHCFSDAVSPVAIVKEHFQKGCKGTCSCAAGSQDDTSDNCLVVKEFDLYNERLLQIGSFAVSCSSDQNRILALRSGLASLEALDPVLVPALSLSPDSCHADLLSSIWRQEVQEIRDSVFLIVDPAAFAEKCKTVLHQRILELSRGDDYNSALVCSVINVGCVLQELFAVYNECEPDVLTMRDKLTPLLQHLEKVQVECKIVSNLLSSPEEFHYDLTNVSTKKGATFHQLLKRLKLLYTIVSRINDLFHPKDQDEQLFEHESCEEAPTPDKNVTHTVAAQNDKTYVNSPRKNTENISRSIFARTANMRSTSFALPLPILTKHLKNHIEELSFSVELHNLFNTSLQTTGKATVIVNKHLEVAREPSILYNCSPKNRSSLRKALLSKNCRVQEVAGSLTEEDSIVSENGMMDDNTSLQITEILDQMTNISNTLYFKPSLNTPSILPTSGKGTDNVLTLKINQNTPVSRQIWNIPVKSAIDSLDDTGANSNVSGASSQPSNVNSLERLCDLDLLDSKLCNLKVLQQESSL